MYKKKTKDLRAVIAAKQQQQSPPSPRAAHSVIKCERKLEVTDEFFFQLRQRHIAVKHENKLLAERVHTLEAHGKEMRKVLDEVQYQSRSGVRLLLEAVKKKKGPLEKQLAHHTEKIQMLKDDQDLAWLQIEALLLVLQRLQTWQEDARSREHRLRHIYASYVVTVSLSCLALEDNKTNPSKPHPIMQVALAILANKLINEDTPGLRSLQKELSQTVS